MPPGPVLLQPKERYEPEKAEEERELEKAKKKQYKRQNPAQAAAQEKMRETARAPAVQTVTKAVEEVPVLVPPKATDAKTAGPRSAAVEQNIRQEVTKTDKFVWSVTNQDTGHQQVTTGQSELIYDEHKKSEQDRFETPQGGAEEKEKEERWPIERLREERGAVGARQERGRAEKYQSPQIVQAAPLEAILQEKERQEAILKRDKEMLKLDKILPAEVVAARQKIEMESRQAGKDNKKLAQVSAQQAGPELAGEERKAEPQIAGEAQKPVITQLKIEQDAKIALDEALENNRPALVVSAVLQKEQNEQFERSLLTVDERQLAALVHEIDRRMKDGQLERMRLVAMMVHEQDLVRKRQIRFRLRKLQVHLAFYSRVKGMLGRLMGGFFGKLAGLKKLFG